MFNVQLRAESIERTESKIWELARGNSIESRFSVALTMLVEMWRSQVSL